MQIFFIVVGCRFWVESKILNEFCFFFLLFFLDSHNDVVVCIGLYINRNLSACNILVVKLYNMSCSNAINDHFIDCLFLVWTQSFKWVFFSFTFFDSHNEVIVGVRFPINRKLVCCNIPATSYEREFCSNATTFSLSVGCLFYLLNQNFQA